MTTETAVAIPKEWESKVRHIVWLHEHSRAIERDEMIEWLHEVHEVPTRELAAVIVDEGRRRFEEALEKTE